MRAVSRKAAVAICVLVALACGALREAAGQRGADVVLPQGVKAVWDLEKAYRETTPTRERISINGLWRWQPAGDAPDAVPADRWGYFKVPGCWPGITSWLQKDSQTVHVHPSWRDESLRSVTMAWYQR
ncbi:MAG: hypothetical protein KAX44_08865, partial [Candidatus Brocadiae bacterium]|nr:hypothetical protein [Candidatus Brocadiia bacterium]